MQFEFLRACASTVVSKQKLNLVNYMKPELLHSECDLGLGPVVENLAH